MNDSSNASVPRLNDLAAAAWLVRENAFVFGPTKVGAALITIGGKVYLGCNVEQQFRSHDVHAEVNAITSMVAGGEKEFVAIVIVAEKLRFTPCGGCMDWIYQFGGPDCLIGYQSKRDAELIVLKAHELMPYYPM